MDIREILRAPGAAGPLGPAVAKIDTAVRCGCALILWLTFLALLAPTFANAFLRYTTDVSLVWSEQMVRLTFPWFIVAGAVLAAQHSRHIGVTVISDLLGAGAFRALQIFIQSVIILACVVVFKFAVGVTLDDDSMYTLIGVPQAVSYAALAVGYALMGLTALTALYRLAAGAPGGGGSAAGPAA